MCVARFALRVADFSVKFYFNWVRMSLVRHRLSVSGGIPIAGGSYEDGSSRNQPEMAKLCPFRELDARLFSRLGRLELKVACVKGRLRNAEKPERTKVRTSVASQFARLLVCQV